MAKIGGLVLNPPLSIESPPMNLGLAFKIFFRTLFNAETADSVRHVLAGDTPALTAEKKAPAPKAPPKPVRSEALTLLATLQREARLIDFLKESLDNYADDQIGAAVRAVPLHVVGGGCVVVARGAQAMEERK